MGVKVDKEVINKSCDQQIGDACGLIVADNIAEIASQHNNGIEIDRIKLFEPSATNTKAKNAQKTEYYSNIGKIDLLEYIMLHANPKLSTNHASSSLFPGRLATSSSTTSPTKMNPDSDSEQFFTPPSSPRSLSPVSDREQFFTPLPSPRSSSPTTPDRQVLVNSKPSSPTKTPPLHSPKNQRGRSGI